MNVINYITITCNLKNVRLQITFDYMKNVIDYNRLVPGRFAPNPVRPLSRFAPIPVRPGSFRPDLLIVL